MTFSRLVPGVDRAATRWRCLPALEGQRSYPLFGAVVFLIYLHSLVRPIDLAGNDAAQQSVSALHLINLIFFTGMSAGAVVVSVVLRALRIRQARPIIRVAEIAAASGLVLVTMFVALDVLHPGHLAQLGRTDLVSAVIADIPIMAIYLANALAVACLASRLDVVFAIGKLRPRHAHYYVLALGEAAVTGLSTVRGLRKLWVLSKPLLLAAVLLRSIPAWMVGLAQVEFDSHRLLIAAPCSISCVVSGLALVIAAATTTRFGRTLAISDRAIRGLGTALRLLVPMLGYSLLAEMRMAIEARDPAGCHLFSELVAGSYAPFFWFASIGGVIVPFLLLRSVQAAGIKRIRLAALLVILGALVERWNTVVPLLLGHAHALYAAGGYAPTVTEAMITTAVYATGFTIYLSLGQQITRPTDLTSRDTPSAPGRCREARRSSPR